MSDLEILVAHFQVMIESYISKRYPKAKRSIERLNDKQSIILYITIRPLSNSYPSKFVRFEIDHEKIIFRDKNYYHNDPESIEKVTTVIDGWVNSNNFGWPAEVA